MARRVFFSFHYDEDITRAQRVRNSWVTQGWTQEEKISRGFFDAGLWEEAKTKGREAIRKLVRESLENTSVTAVLIGAETYSREYVLYEIEKSYDRNNGLLGVYVGSLRDLQGNASRNGPNPFNYVSSVPSFPTYDWIRDDGYNNFGKWVEEAYKASGRS